MTSAVLEEEKKELNKQVEQLKKEVEMCKKQVEMCKKQVAAFGLGDFDQDVRDLILRN